MIPHFQRIFRVEPLLRFPGAPWVETAMVKHQYLHRVWAAMYHGGMALEAAKEWVELVDTEEENERRGIVASLR